MIKGILGRKIGMTQVFDENGRKVPVTVMEAGPCTVQAVKVDDKDGYNAVRLGFADMKEKRLKKPQREEAKKNKLKAKKFAREIRCDAKPEVKVGDEITNSIFQKGDHLDVIGVSKGKGFQGGVKRHGWTGGRDTHGSMFHRAPGSIGASSYPSRVFKGQTLPGHMGNAKSTVQNLVVVDVDIKKHTVSVRGAVPGANGTYLVMKFAKKKVIAKRAAAEETDEKADSSKDKE